MPAQIAFRLLLSSGLPRLNYLCRVLSPAALTHATHAFDQLILKTLYKILNIKTDKHRHRRSLEKFSHHIQLKMKNGGLGLTRYSDIAPAAFLSSLSNASPLILSLYEEMGEGSDAVRLTEEKYDKLLKIIFRRLHDICDESALTSVLPSTIPISDLSSTRIPGAVCHDTHPSPLLYENSSKADFIRQLQSKLTSAIEKKKLQRYQSSIDRSSKARLLSASQPSASTWLTTIPEENDLSLNDSQFCAAIRHRLAIPTQSKCCQCEPEAGIINDSIHPHTCKLLKKEEINQRHEYIVYTLHQLCDLANQHSSIYHRLNYDNIDKNIRPDLYVYINGIAYMIDGSILCPAASSHVHSHNADEIPLSSAIHRGKEKVRKYHRLARQNHMKFVPFILESFGAIDKQARSFISLLAEQTNDPHQFFAYCMRRLSIALQRGNSDIQTRGMKRLLLDQSSSVNDRHQQVPNILFYNDASSSDSDRDCSSSEDSDWDGEGDGDINDDDDQRNDWDWIGRMEEGRMGNE